MQMEDSRMRRERAVVVEDRRDDSEPGVAGQGATRRVRLLASLMMCSALSVSCGFLFNDGAPPSPEALAEAAGELGADATTAVESSAPAAAGARGAASKPPTASNANPTSTGTASASAPTSTSTSTTINSVDTIVNDMKLNNDLVLAGIPSNRGYAAGPGFVVMGNDPRGTRTPTWWNPANSYFKSAAWWTHVAPWMVIFDGVGNAATNTRVELRGMKIYYKSRSTRQWNLLSQGTVEGWNYPKSLMGADVTPPDIVSLSSGVVSVRPPNGNQVFHGWCCARAMPAPSDIEAIHITLQARLAVHDANRPDDRSAARYLVQVGGDYYPDASLSINAFAPDNWNPGIGLSRSKLVGNAWQSYSFTTLDVAIQDPGGAAMSEAELRRAPPPLD
jgi:hypothetical protein